MSILLLSFVGSQDPYSNTTQQPGSIVSLVEHLRQQQQPIKRAWLLYTQGTAQNAIDTKVWLLSEAPELSEAAVELIEVSPAFSQDPVDPLLASQAARRAVELAKPHQTAGDRLAFNASSGTPAMKTAWSVLQAAGYAPYSQVWQVRNPKEIQAEQARVFQSNVDSLKREFDLKVAKQQILDYNYGGALRTLEANQLPIEPVKALLQYADYRLARDFDRAFSSLQSAQAAIDRRWIQEIAQLRQKHRPAQLQEAYFNALIRLKNRQYASFLIDVFGLQESLLRGLVQQQFGLELSGDPAQREQMWQQIKQVESGKLFQYLQTYRLPKGDPLRLGESISRYVILAILQYDSTWTEVMPDIQYLNEYCSLRNQAVHEFIGVSEIPDELKLLTTLDRLLKRTTKLTKTNPFDDLNQQICDYLERDFTA